ncbi:CP family cyanate transporter-like MFS transporter [Microcella putealis]|uniref:CP family cyanate transporter-like MFS transporter n=1 Tax=Microcella putealis TaxID=337005 RepID=A0A4Q7LW39_9MICO|nr:MFS transporter [Microcella putealis]RZS59064.1 CP family cyanate transporter-like MFS transporter [Microcella putealis]TQM24090.1 CP family cyanate transporter-like MFS transporter [Microcella putealis]
MAEPSAEHPGGPRGARAVSAGLALAAVIAMAANLRTGVAGLAPISPQISADIPLSASVLGVLGLAAPLGFVIAGLLSPLLAHRFGIERTLAAAVVAMIVGHLLRAIAPDVTTLLLGSVVVLLGAGVGNILLPGAVKRYLPDRFAAVTAAYGTAMSIGSAIPPLVAVPIAVGIDWRVSLAVWSVGALVALAPWIVVARRAARQAVARAAVDAEAGQAGQAGEAAPAASVPNARGALRLARSRTVWGITIGFAVSGMSAYTVFALLPVVLRESAGVSATAAGALVALFSILGLPLALSVPVLGARLATPTPLLIAATVLLATGWGGLWLAPALAPAVWVTAVGLGQISFPLGLTLIGLRTRSPQVAAGVSAFIQTVGYLAAAIVPPVLGVLRDATGSWAWSMGVMTVLTFGAAASIPLLRTRGIVDDELGQNAPR